jgi:hypothetical protein
MCGQKESTAMSQHRNQSDGKSSSDHYADYAQSVGITMGFVHERICGAYIIDTKGMCACDWSRPLQKNSKNQHAIIKIWFGCTFSQEDLLPLTSGKARRY